MEKSELMEVLDQYRDSESDLELVRVLKEKMVQVLDSVDVDSDSRRHDLNMMMRDIEEELDYIESEKLAEYDPERS